MTNGWALDAVPFINRMATGFKNKAIVIIPIHIALYAAW